MKQISILCLMLMLFAGCKENSSENITVVEQQPLRYLALGDSYTIGESVAPEMRWPVQLVEQLRAMDLKLKIPGSLPLQVGPLRIF
ncbi:hypothetical protein VS868_03085 [Salinimicrobium sp. 3283s]|uniref:hypothetical protein n=1 Tax=Salinimicrobium sp. 3283s TaxID=3114359 RepID=UPI0031E6C582